MEQTIIKKEDGRGNGTRSFCRRGEKGFCHPKWCGLFMIIAGLLWLGARLNWLSGDLFWPLLLIIMGTSIVLSVLLKRGSEEKGKQLTYPDGGR
jgi:hypothetical protein